MKWREEPLESRVDLFAVIVTSGLSRASECLNAHSQAPKVTSGVDKVADEVETDADGHGASAARELTSSHQVVSQQVEDTLVQDGDVIQAQPLFLRKGKIAKYLLDMDRLLQV